LREAEAAVLDGDLDAEGSDLREFIEQHVGYLASGIDGIGIGVFIQNGLQPVQEGIALIAILNALFREGQQAGEIRLAEEKACGEAGVTPFIAGGFRHFQGGSLARVHAGGVDEGFRLGRNQGGVHGRDRLLPVSTIPSPPCSRLQRIKNAWVGLLQGFENLLPRFVLLRGVLAPMLVTLHFECGVVKIQLLRRRRRFVFLKRRPCHAAHDAVAGLWHGIILELVGEADEPEILLFIGGRPVKLFVIKDLDAKRRGPEFIGMLEPARHIRLGHEGGFECLFRNVFLVIEFLEVVTSTFGIVNLQTGLGEQIEPGLASGMNIRPGAFEAHILVRMLQR
jgi:hypothetical protein